MQFFCTNLGIFHPCPLNSCPVVALSGGTGGPYPFLLSNFIREPYWVGKNMYSPTRTSYPDNLFNFAFGIPSPKTPNFPISLTRNEKFSKILRKSPSISNFAFYFLSATCAPCWGFELLHPQWQSIQMVVGVFHPPQIACRRPF